MRASTLELVKASGRLVIPAGLPIADRRDDLLAAIRDHQVVIVAGETGSGKSTQLPKLCLELGRGVAGLIGHTQPRRVAARTIAQRVADELGVELGGAVGYAVRFTDKVGANSLVKVMTDGILLAELQRDRMLRRYDTLIIDEAHERSLNIDFILGYLKQLLPRRPDLKVIVTSATIDTERFSEHFLDAPVVTVSGRTYPVEMRYRPFGLEPDDDRDQVQAVCDAVVELQREGDGDVLVFLSGEREIHDTADALRRMDGGRTDVLPLYARLSSAEQQRIFQPHTGRRVVLATNVAETSLTVPGVRYVVDAGSARISRYSLRLKVQRLPIERVSQASANQRAGRCGRVAPGICIRLYTRDDFDARDEYTEPEILRTNLASVILQMTAIGLGDVDAFPFLDPPDKRAVRDGYALLEELSAIEPVTHRLTKLGGRLARLPIDPRHGRMIIAAERHGCVREVMIIAAALSIQDPRERPTEHRQAADEMHRRFNVDGSDFLVLVKLWDYLREQQHALSSSQFRKLCRAEYLNYLRVREWQDLFSQLRQVAATLDIRTGSEAGHPDRIHQALLAGLLSHLGMRDGASREFRGAHGSRFVVGQGSSLSKHPPKWLMAAELVETNRLWARMVAAVQPEWAEELAGSLVKYSYGDPTWDPRRAGAIAFERATLFGLPIVSGRRIGYDRVDKTVAREMFVRCALIEGDWRTHHRFVADNLQVLANAHELAERMRRGDLVDDEGLQRFYEQRIGPDVVTGRHFDKWWKTEQAKQPDLLTVIVEHLLGELDAGADHPTVWPQDDLALSVTYRFDPGAPDDGVTVHVPLAVLNRVRIDGFDWQVPAYRDDLVIALVKTLPKEVRRELTPAAQTVRAALDRLNRHGHESTEPLAVALARALCDVAPATVTANQFDVERVPQQLRITFAVHDGGGRVVGSGHDLDVLRYQLAKRLRIAVAAASPVDERRGIVTWDVGSIEREVETSLGGAVVVGYPALLDDGDSVSLRVFTNPGLQQRVMRGGVRRLLMLATAPSRAAVTRGLSNAHKLAVARCGVVTLDELADDCIAASADEVMRDAPLPWDALAFEALRKRAKDSMATLAGQAMQHAAAVCVEAIAVTERTHRLVVPAVQPAVADCQAQLGRLVRPGFVTSTGLGRLPDVVRYLTAIDRRLDKLTSDPLRDAQRMAEVVQLERRYSRFVRHADADAITPEVIDAGWMLEELRVGLFAQSLGTSRTVSVKRVDGELRRLGA